MTLRFDEMMGLTKRTTAALEEAARRVKRFDETLHLLVVNDDQLGRTYLDDLKLVTDDLERRSIDVRVTVVHASAVYPKAAEQLAFEMRRRMEKRMPALAREILKDWMEQAEKAMTVQKSMNPMEGFES